MKLAALYPPQINGSVFDVKFQLTSEATYEPIVFLKQPYSLQGSISFGNKNETSQIILENPTEIRFDVFADISKSANGVTEKEADSKDCSRDVLKFSPPPQNKVCDQNVYKHLTTLRDYGLNITFHNVSVGLCIHF